MTIEIKIIACSKSDLMLQLKNLAELAVAPIAPAVSLDNFSMQEIVNFLEGQGYTIAPNDLVDEAIVVNADKKARRAKKPAPASEEKEADTPAETAYNGDDEDLKSEVIARCSQLMLDGRRDVVLALKKQFGRTLSDLPADRFHEIGAELERILEDGELDE